MNTNRYLLTAAFAVGISVQLPSAYAATVVTHSATPAYAATTVHTTGPYWGIQPAPCCYTRVVVAPTATIAVAPVAPPPARVVYTLPTVTVYPTAKAIYVPSTHNYVP
ncbi:hypothetical protein [Dyella flagellata]|uniref:Uncharacterized protein n=1 Tax=Dyella flagellata TaxID=1867833 RepID=A0ABQ5XF89_9GAMM|nr:hypothetical protein [Dyella flagellata]GLQ89859.1 hypothetical protein GCM10007898_34340 [Dyella flagellata]